MSKSLKDAARARRQVLAEKEGAKSQNHTITKTPNQQSDKALKNKLANRETYYIPKALHNRLKILAIQQEKSPSDLVQEAVETLLKKYEG